MTLPNVINSERQNENRYPGSPAKSPIPIPGKSSATSRLSMASPHSASANRQEDGAGGQAGMKRKTEGRDAVADEIAIIDDGYPDTAEGMTLHKASATETGYKGVTKVRLPVPGFLGRDGSKRLGIFSTRVEAALAFARSKQGQKEEKHCLRKEQRRNNNKRHNKGIAQPKPEQTAASADAHYSEAEAQRYTERNEQVDIPRLRTPRHAHPGGNINCNSQVQRELAQHCLHLLQAKSKNSAPQLLLDLGCGSGLSSAVLEAAGHTCVGIDAAREMLMLAAPGGGGRLVLGDLRALPLRVRLLRAPPRFACAMRWLALPQGHLLCEVGH